MSDTPRQIVEVDMTITVEGQGRTFRASATISGNPYGEAKDLLAITESAARAWLAAAERAT